MKAIILLAIIGAIVYFVIKRKKNQTDSKPDKQNRKAQQVHLQQSPTKEIDIYSLTPESPLQDIKDAWRLIYTSSDAGINSEKDGSISDIVSMVVSCLIIRTDIDADQKVELISEYWLELPRRLRKADMFPDQYDKTNEMARVMFKTAIGVTLDELEKYENAHEAAHELNEKFVADLSTGKDISFCEYLGKIFWILYDYEGKLTEQDLINHLLNRSLPR